MAERRTWKIPVMSEDITFKIQKLVTKGNRPLKGPNNVDNAFVAQGPYAAVGPSVALAQSWTIFNIIVKLDGGKRQNIFNLLILVLGRLCIRIRFPTGKSDLYGPD
jgi:hypothetical protein